MTKFWRSGWRRVGVAAALAAGAALAAATPATAARAAGLAAAGVRAGAAVPGAAALPDRMSDADFWKLETDVSEPGGYFRITDNFTSNEREVGRLFTMIRDRGLSGGVYLGVGPEQNFTYIAAIRPAMAFVVDIRRQAVMQHLMFKAVFELAKDRADFISILFSRPRPAGLGETTPIQAMWDAYFNVATDPALAAKNQTRIVDLLTKTHQFTFTADESSQLESVLSAFVTYGPVISTRGAGGGGGRGAMGGSGGTFADLTGYVLDDSGQPQSFLSSEAHFQTVKALEDRNLVVPVSGDFGGPKALRAIGAWLHEHGGTVTAFYVSNVEQYLFQDGKQNAFYDNVATLPLDDRSVFIRPYALRGYGGADQALCGITAFLASARAGRVYSNNEALACVH